MYISIYAYVWCSWLCIYVWNPSVSLETDNVLYINREDEGAQQRLFGHLAEASHELMKAI